MMRIHVRRDALLGFALFAWMLLLSMTQAEANVPGVFAPPPPGYNPNTPTKPTAPSQTSGGTLVNNSTKPIVYIASNDEPDPDNPGQTRKVNRLYVAQPGETVTGVDVDAVLDVKPYCIDTPEGPKFVPPCLELDANGVPTDPVYTPLGIDYTNVKAHKIGDGVTATATDIPGTTDVNVTFDAGNPFLNIAHKINGSLGKPIDPWTFVGGRNPFFEGGPRPSIKPEPVTGAPPAVGAAPPPLVPDPSQFAFTTFDGIPGNGEGQVTHAPELPAPLLCMLSAALSSLLSKKWWLSKWGSVTRRTGRAVAWVKLTMRTRLTNC